jgi:putative ABC transport system permease protein
MNDSPGHPSAPAPSLGTGLALWRRLTMRHWREDRWATLLLLLLLSLGVASYLSVRLANRAAVDGFALFHQTLQPRSDWVLRSPVGRLPVERLSELRGHFGLAPAGLFPLLETSATRIPDDEPETAGPPARTIRVVGLDLVALGTAGESLLAEVEAGPDDFLDGDPPPVWVTAQVAEAWQAGPGTRVTLRFNTRPVRVTVAGLLPARTPAGEPPPWLAVMDLPALQTAAGLDGLVDRVEVILPSGEAWREAVAKAGEALRADPRWSLATPEEEGDRGLEMTAAFRLNLTILSLIALLVALYLIAQALDAVVVRRRQEIAILRSLGLTPGMLRRLWFAEFLTLGLAGSLGGLLLGWGLAQGTAGAVAQTVNQLYFQTEHSGAVGLRAVDALLALLLGVGGSLLAGWLPLRDAAGTPPAQILAAGNFSPGFGVLRRPGWGLGLVLFGALLWPLPPLPLAGGARFPLAGYLTALCWLVGGTLLLGGGFRPLAAILRPFDGAFPTLRLARARLADTTSRHRLAAAGLFVAVTMAGGMNVLVGSFARTMEDWIEVRFQADLYLSSAATGGAGAEFLLEPDTVAAVAALPSVAEADPFRFLPLELEGRRTYLGASRHELLDNLQPVLWLVSPRAPGTAPEGVEGRALVNEAFVARFGLGADATVTLPTPTGPRLLWIRGVFADYGNEQGLLWIDWKDFRAWFGSEAATTLSLFLHPGTDPLAVAGELETSFPGLAVRDNGTLRTLVRRIFRQTFAITEALQLIGLLVAMGGLALALGNLLRESRRELHTLRALGLRRGEIARATAWEGAGIAALGIAGGLPASLGLGALLVFVINRQSFGWTLRFDPPWAEFGLLAVLTLGLALAVGAWVGWRHARLMK